jgi:hypothetical protein
VTFNHGVEGSSPSALTNENKYLHHFLNLVLPLGGTPGAQSPTLAATSSANRKSLPEKCGSPTLAGCRSSAATTNALTQSSSMPIRGGDNVRLSDLEPKFTCKVCGNRGADIRPLFEQAKMGAS